MKRGAAQHKVYDVQDAREAIRRYCAYQERSQHEVSEKLQSMGLIPMVVDLLMVELIEEGYVNELRFAEAFARGRFRQKGWGRLKIKDKLYQRKISQACIQLALESIDDDEYLDQLRQLAMWKWEKVKAPNDFVRRQKVMGFLYQRGFEYDLIRPIVDAF